MEELGCVIPLTGPGILSLIRPSRKLGWIDGDALWNSIFEKNYKLSTMTVWSDLDPPALTHRSTTVFTNLLNSQNKKRKQTVDLKPLVSTHSVTTRFCASRPL